MTVQFSLRSSSWASFRASTCVVLLLVALPLFYGLGISSAVAATRAKRSGATRTQEAPLRPSLLGLWDDRDTGGVQGLRGGVGSVRILFRPHDFQLTSLYRTRYGVLTSQAVKTVTGKYRVEGSEIVLDIRRCSLQMQNSGSPVERAPCDDMWRPANVRLQLDGTRLSLRGRPLAGFIPAPMDETTTLLRVPLPTAR